MVFKEIIRKIVSKNPNLSKKLKLAGMNQSPFQYVFQTLYLTGLFVIGFCVFFIILFAGTSTMYWAIAITIGLMPFVYSFLMKLVDVKANQFGRELEGDILFISEYLLVVLESGVPLPNALEQLAKIKRPGGIFFDKVLRDFKLGKDLDRTLDDAITYCPSPSLRSLIKRLKDSLVIGVDLQKVLSNFVEESSKKKLIEIRGFGKKLNPIIMMYLIFGIVIPSLGVTFFILFAAISGMGSELLRVVLIFTFMFMFVFQYIAYSSLKFTKSTM